MKNISSIVETTLKKHLKDYVPELNYTLSNNLEFRLFPSSSLRKFKEAKKVFLKNYLNDLLVLSLGNISLAAKKANLHRRHLHRIIHELEIDPNTHRKELIKPTEYIKENIHDILEETLSNFTAEPQKIKTVYSNLEDISEVLAKNMEKIVSYEEALELFEKEFLGKALKENNYDVSKTAEVLDMNERTLYRKMSKLNIAIA
jgi:DNA-binding NtrC family response regulator